MIACLTAAPASGTGKTAVTCGLLELLKRKGRNPCAFKCGPDYIDAMFHRSVLGVESRNLDSFLAEEEVVRSLYRRGCRGHQSVVCEGVMGFYDGVGGTTARASAWHIADTLDLPVLMIVRPKGAGLTLAAQLRGLDSFRTPSHIKGILLNDCSPMQYRSLAPMLEKETGIPVPGYLPHLEAAEFESRHLGLRTAGEIEDLAARIGSIADALEKTLDWARFEALFDAEPPETAEEPAPARKSVRLALAQDRAFCFTYAETLEALEAAGAEIVPFSPVADERLPEGIDGLYLPGGYPELYSRELAENRSMRESIRNAVTAGLPTAAECGGFLYLGRSLRDADGTERPMAGVLDGNAEKKERLVRFGYAEMTAKKDSMLFRTGETVPVHEFHYWDSAENGTAFHAAKPIGIRSWECGFAGDSLYAGFPHLYFAGHPELVQRWVRAMEQWKNMRQSAAE